MSSVPVFAALNPTWLLLAGMAVLTSVMVRLTYRRYWRARRPHRPPHTSPRSEAGAIAGTPGYSTSYQELLRTLESKEVEFNELSREALARLDNKIVLLQHLLAESETTIARLQEAAANARSARVP